MHSTSENGERAYAGAIAELHDRLLPETVRQALMAPAYRELWSECDPSRVRSVEQLRELPLLDRAAVERQRERLLVPGLQPSHVQWTTGTTGSPLVLWRAHAESVAIARIFRPEPSTTPRALVLSVREDFHGTATAIPTRQFALEASIADERSIEHALDLLTRRFEAPGIEERVTLVSGTDTALRALAHYAAHAGMDLAALPVKAILTYGDFVPRSVRGWLEHVWGAPLVDRYSCAEHFGGASSFPGNDLYRFDPHVIAEVVDVLSGEPVRSGVGVLVLTSLHPFVQLMPLIRYRTDDLVEVVNGEDPQGSLVVRLKGRLRDAVPERSGRPLLHDADARNAVEGLPGVVYVTRRTNLTAPGLARAIGRPRYRAALADDGSRLLFQAWCESPPPPSLAEDLAHRIVEESAELGVWLHDRSTQLEVSVHPSAVGADGAAARHAVG